MTPDIKAFLKSLRIEKSKDLTKKFISESNTIDFVQLCIKESFFEWSDLYIEGFIDIFNDHIKEEININRCHIREFVVRDKANIEKIQMVNADIDTFRLQGCDIGTINAVKCEFGEFDIRSTTFTDYLYFNNCKFNENTFISGKILCKSVFNNSIFYKGLKFKGYRRILLSAGKSEEKKLDEIIKLFSEETQLQDITFMMPDKVTFDGVNLKNAYLIGTNPKLISLTDIDWYQESLKRNGLYDEVFLNQGDENFQEYYLPKVESAYRKFRVALEENKDFSSAQDFYVGEMECKRRQIKGWLTRNIFSLEGCYYWLSKYGTSPVRAFIILLCLAILHGALTGIDQGCFTNPIACHIDFAKVARTLNVITLRSVQPENNFIDSIFRIITPVQIALFGLAMRNKIKRS